mgnify:CR=1 FL=1
MTKYICLIIIMALSFHGCFYLSSNWEREVYNKPPTEWNSRECLTIIAASISHNLLDYRTNIKVIATPYYPSVIMALYRNGNEIKQWTKEQYQTDVDALMKDDVGLYYDWVSNKLIDGRGNYYRDKSQIDSLMFLVTIQNRAYSSGGSMMQVKVGASIVWAPLVSPDQIYIPDISTLEDRIFLVNEQKMFIKPKYVWGKRHNTLTIEETLLLMFNLKNGEKHFLEKSENMYLVVKGFERDIELTFPLAYMR